MRPERIRPRNYNQVLLKKNKSIKKISTGTNLFKLQIGTVCKHIQHIVYDDTTVQKRNRFWYKPIILL